MTSHMYIFNRKHPLTYSCEYSISIALLYQYIYEIPSSAGTAPPTCIGFCQNPHRRTLFLKGKHVSDSAPPSESDPFHLVPLGQIFRPAKTLDQLPLGLVVAQFKGILSRVVGEAARSIRPRKEDRGTRGIDVGWGLGDTGRRAGSSVSYTFTFLRRLIH